MLKFLRSSKTWVIVLWAVAIIVIVIGDGDLWHTIKMWMTNLSRINFYIIFK
jgi:hypothetical protein